MEPDSLKNPYYSRTNTEKLNVENAQWKKLLPETLYAIAREKDTERPFTGKYLNTNDVGTYYCAVCGNPLFLSDTKFSSSCGWPSFFKTINEKSVRYEDDFSHGKERIEVLCNRCDSHLGHLFDDGPEPTGKRYCMNSLSLDFEPNLKTLVLGGGCFWCVEAIYEQLEGVIQVESGYAGGTILNPSYEAVSSGTTGHAEVIKIYYDPSKINYEMLLLVFFDTHDPTSLNKQGEDVGTQYRSVIFYEDRETQEKAQKMIKTLKEEAIYDKPIVTSLEPLTNYTKAENYHQNYYNLNKEKNTYCRIVITPKLEKFKKKYQPNLK